MTTTDARPSGGVARPALWIARGLLALMFLQAGVRKWLGDDGMTATFEELGAGQWLRYVTGTIEIVGAFGLLLPFSVAFAALGLFGVMVGAILTELVIVEDGNPTTPVVLLVLVSVVAWFHRETMLPVLHQVAPRPSLNRRTARE